MPQTFFFKPTPAESLRERGVVPFTTTITRTLATRTAGAGEPEPVIFQSIALDTQGYFLVNGFVEVNVLADSRPNTEPVRFIGGLALDNGGGFQQAVTSTIQNAQGGAYAGPGSYTFPVLASDIGISRQSRFVLQASSDAGNPVRTVTLRLDGVLVSGYAI